MGRGFVQHLNLIREFVITDFKLKYQSSFLGYFWSLLNPLLMFGTLYAVFSVFARFDVPQYHLFLLLGIILWGFFSEATVNAMYAIQAKGSIIKKVYFPRELVVLASALTTLLSLMLNLVVFFVFFFLSGGAITAPSLFLVVYLINIFLLASGTAFILSPLYLRFVDTAYLWRVMLQAGFWITPIIYPLTMIPEKWRIYVLLNPLASIINGARETV